MANTRERNYGIDALRLVSMLGIVIFHIFSHGGALESASGATYVVGKLLMTLVYPSVNCYAIISGYVGYSDTEKPYRYARYLAYWLQAAFYCVTAALIFYLLGADDLPPVKVVQAALPVTSEQYWYFTAYSALFFLIPWMNRFVRRLSRSEMTCFVLVIFIIFSLYADFICNFDDHFFLKAGYGFLWIALLYLVGAWMRKCAIPESVDSKTAFLVCAVCLFVQWALKTFLQRLFFVNESYNNPLFVLAAMGWVVIFSKLRFEGFGRKLIRCLAPAALGVYLIHDQRFVRKYLIDGRFAWIAGSSPVMLVLEVLGCALAIFAVCLLIEKLRMWLFKMLRVNKLTDAAARVFGRCARRIAGKIIRFVD